MSEPSMISREQIDTLRGLLNDVQASDEAGNRALTAIGDMLDRVEARGVMSSEEVKRLQAKNERQYNELVAWETNYPCDGMCQTNGGAEEDCSRHGRRPKDLWEQIERLARTRNVLSDEVDRLTEENARLRLGLRPESGAAAWAQHVGATLDHGLRVDGAVPRPVHPSDPADCPICRATLGMAEAPNAADEATTAPRATYRAPVGESDNANTGRLA